MDNRPFVSIIIPVYNANRYIAKCLSAIALSSYSSFEVIVVDDGSTDDSSEIARKTGATVLKLSSQSGPAAARNFGSKEARGDILLFVDSDIVIQKDTLSQIVYDFDTKSDIAALFGSYDDSPAEQNFSSLYMNLRHHFVHQNSNTEATTFWAGCGAIRKAVFEAVGGYDYNKYSRPCIEDIELGLRLRKNGYQIYLDKNIQVKHLKKWTLKSVIRTDIFHRAIPWTKLILTSQEMITDLNLQFSHKISAVLLGLTIIIVPLLFFIPELIVVILTLVTAIFILNNKLFIFFLKRKGLVFTLLAFKMHLLYFFYSGASYASCWILYKIRIIK